MDFIANSMIIFSAKYLLIASAVIAIFYVAKQSHGKRKGILVFAIILLPLSYIIAKIISHFYFDSRPFAEGNFAPLIAHSADNGFPSDHTLLAAAIAAVVYRLNKKAGVALFFIALIIGLARVLAGVHHIADIIGSIAIVLVVYFLVRKLAPNT